MKLGVLTDCFKEGVDRGITLASSALTEFRYTQREVFSRLTVLTKKHAQNTKNYSATASLR